MPTQIVYLHIPKSGGTSQRLAFYDIYGEDKVFWYGIDNDAGTDLYDEDQLEPFTLLGGHKHINFYPQSLDALYISVVREPIIRAVSLYSYYAKPDFAETHFVSTRKKLFQNWQDRGMDSDSMVNSLRRCPEFRQEVENQQCRYLSRYGNTFQGVKQTLSEVTAVIGELDSTISMNTFLSERMNWGHVQQRKVNASLEDTHTTILQEPGLKDLITELVQEDLCLYEFIHKEHKGIFNNLPADLKISDSLSPLKPFCISLQDSPPWKQVQVYTKGYIGINEDGSGSTGIVIINNSLMAINREHFPALAIYYTLHSKDGCQLGNGIFQHSLEVPIAAKGKLIWNLKVKIPRQYVAEAACIQVGLSVGESELAATHCPLHLGSANIISV
jgi:hypothetical protein